MHPCDILQQKWLTTFNKSEQSDNLSSFRWKYWLTDLPWAVQSFPGDLSEKETILAHLSDLHGGPAAVNFIFWSRDGGEGERAWGPRTERTPRTGIPERTPVRLCVPLVKNDLSNKAGVMHLTFMSCVLLIHLLHFANFLYQICAWKIMQILCGLK